MSDSQNGSGREDAPKPQPYYPKSVNDALKKENKQPLVSPWQVPESQNSPSQESPWRFPDPQDSPWRIPERPAPDLTLRASEKPAPLFDFDQEEQEDREEREKREQRETAPKRERRADGQRRPSPLWAFFFPAALLYHELLLRVFDGEYTRFFAPALGRAVLFSLAAGLLVWALLDLIPKKNVSRVLGGAAVFLFLVLTCVERGVREFFGMYFGLTTVTSMGGEVAGDFQAETVSTIVEIIPFILLSLLPFAAFLLLRRRVLPERGASWSLRGALLFLAVACQLLGWGLSAFGSTRPEYTYEYNFTNAVPDFGLLTAQRLELEYAVFGLPEDESATVDGPFFDPNAVSTQDPGSASTPADTEPPGTGEPAGTGPEDTTPESTQPPKPVEYGYHMLESIDFESLYENETNKDIKAMHKYFGSLTPSKENEYTGLFAGKNLIFITAESFSTYCMSPELTPTLWRLSHEGFVFDNYYQPDWTMSTAGGEFANVTGVIPNWVSGKMTIYAVLGNSMPMALGSMFTDAGYNVNAYHNHKYGFYKRDQLYPTLGFEHYNAANGGTEGGMAWPEDQKNDWPKSDLTMMEVTVDDYINEYLSTGVPFMTYYMTVSAHAEWNWANDMANKNKAAAQAAYPDASRTVQAYIACNLELEAAMKYLVEKLEAAGIADDTLIVLSTDHYPYKMLTDDADYYSELRGFTDTEKDTSRFKSTLIMWSPSVKEPIQVEVPCYSCDILPTVLNLFGIEYESRLYSGRDVMDPNYDSEQYSTSMPIAIFANNKGQGNSWITAAGTYEAATKTFTPNPGITVPDDYVKKVNALVSNRIKYAKQIISQDYYAHIFG